MYRQYTHVQGLLPNVMAIPGNEEGYTYRPIAEQSGLAKKQIEELCSRGRRKQQKTDLILNGEPEK